MLHAMSAPAHSETHPHLKIHEHKLIKNTQSTANERAKGDHLESTADQAGVAQALDDVFHEPQAAVSVEGEDRLGMKLDGFHRQIAMADTHDDSVVALRGDFETAWKLFGYRV